MGQILAVMNMKGGVGKTVVSLTLADYLAKRAVSRVLLVDWDPQFNATQEVVAADRVAQFDDSRRTAADILLPRAEPEDPFTIESAAAEDAPGLADLCFNLWKWKNRGSLDLVPSSFRLMEAALGEKSDTVRAQMERRFNDFAEHARTAYDWVVVDCHPAGSLLTRVVLRAADHVVIPVVPDAFSLRGIGLMHKYLLHVERFRRTAVQRHIVINRQPGSTSPGWDTQIDNLRTHPTFGPWVLDDAIPETGHLRIGVTQPPDDDPAKTLWDRGGPYSQTQQRRVRDVIEGLLRRFE